MLAPFRLQWSEMLPRGCMVQGLWFELENSSFRAMYRSWKESSRPRVKFKNAYQPDASAPGWR